MPLCLPYIFTPPATTTELPRLIIYHTHLTGHHHKMLIFSLFTQRLSFFCLLLPDKLEHTPGGNQTAQEIGKQISMGLTLLLSGSIIGSMHKISGKCWRRTSYRDVLARARTSTHTCTHSGVVRQGTIKSYLNMPYLRRLFLHITAQT